MLKNVFAHWKTTLSGAAIAVGQVLLNGRSGKSVLIAALIAIVGAVSKDPNS